MSFNQSKSDKNESQYRKPGGGGRSGNSGQQRNFTGTSGRGGGAGFTAPHAATNPSSVSSNRSFNKKGHNAQAGQSRVVAGSVNAASTAPVQNGSHSQHAHPAVSHKPNDMANQKNTAPIPRAPPSQPSTLTSDSTTTPKTPAKGDGAKGFSLQFGSISPGLMNGMQFQIHATLLSNFKNLVCRHFLRLKHKGRSPVALGHHAMLIILSQSLFLALMTLHQVVGLEHLQLLPTS